MDAGKETKGLVSRVDVLGGRHVWNTALSMHIRKWKSSKDCETLCISEGVYRIRVTNLIPFILQQISRLTVKHVANGI